MNCFEEEYSCFSLSSSSTRKSTHDDGNTIIMPDLALRRLVALNRQVSINVDYPLIFEIKNHTGGVSLHCGVLKFTLSAEDGAVFLPNWMIKNMKLEEGELVFVNLKSASLPKGTCVKIRPKCTSLSNPNPNSKDVLRRNYINTRGNKRSRIDIGMSSLGGSESDHYSSSSSSPDWSTGLPWDLLVCILSKLNRLADYDRFGMVCGTWRSACVDLHNQQQLRAKTLENTPLLLLPRQRLPPPPDEMTLSGGGPEDQWTCNLYDLFQRKLVVRDLKLPALSKPYGRCCGSSHGWLIFADIYSSITLVNPFREEAGGGGGIIHLPPIYKNYVPGDEDFSTSSSDDDNDSLHEFDVRKVVLSADPGLSPHNYYAIAIFGMHRKLLIIKSGNKSWTCLDDDRRYHDVICQDDGEVYAAVNRNQILYCKLKVSHDDVPNPNNPSDQTNNNNNFIEEIFRLYIAPFRFRLSEISKYYIVKSEGELLLVYRFLVGSGSSQIDPRTRGFKVYKIILHVDGAGCVPGGGRVVQGREMKSLGDRVLFLGENHSTCLSTTSRDDNNYNLLGCRSNSIYFTDDTFASLVGAAHLPMFEMGRTLSDMGVFNLEEQSISLFYDLPDLSDLLYGTPPIWFFPSFPPRN